MEALIIYGIGVLVIFLFSCGVTGWNIASNSVDISEQFMIGSIVAIFWPLVVMIVLPIIIGYISKILVDRIKQLKAAASIRSPT